MDHAVECTSVRFPDAASSIRCGSTGRRRLVQAMAPIVWTKPDLGCFIYLQGFPVTGTSSHILRIWLFSMTFICKCEPWISNVTRGMTSLPRACGRRFFVIFPRDSGMF